MNTNSNSYTIIYASIMVVVVAFLLAFVSSSLKEKQDKNVELDKMKQILNALNIRDVQNPEAEYQKYVKADQILNAQGAVVSENGGFKIASKDIKADNLPLYVCDVDGARKYVFPVYGAGLWGPIWGYVCLNEDKNTVYGVYFSHESETPGLGAEIDSEKFQRQFSNKHVVNDGEVELGVVKNGKVENPEFQVDGISGGTITSKGVDAMLKNCLSEYNAFLNQK
ncbi:MAG: Na(+)-translocating NADH-quinone reductase subunit C [Paludibacteraceae bacterium]|nr:Na(+)-translocating NADH-quinone reductase subunit C [Paludibacteraceae bacterium]HOI26423.1 Na(+)-translocating NADH-quinone reductase subunit C [Paludibacteraceae bacterium]HOU68548.1 Na(+)-translocating NADH-quinone reductase subunit C [Paludibacteraceae bacterium]HPH63442.1 Na(+)-translocating NADH-quinone reductase subunit C [Paludibacteraceae bacterium]HQF50376.1 Na(+)-translocating NADH-quinone reductase subunit C [Paludibacteraceae bacterium]